MYGSQRWGTMPSATRARVALLAFVLGIVGLFGLFRAQTEAVGAPPQGKIQICHATGSAKNPYVLINVSKSAADGQGKNDHTSHADDIIPANGACPTSNPGGGPDKKIDVCHHTSSATNPIVQINISENAWPAHQAHGDTLADPVTGCTTPSTPPPGPTDDPKSPPASVVVTEQAAAAVQGSAENRAPARVCSSRRSFRIRIRSKRRDPVVRATVTVNGKRVQTLKGKRITAPVVLRGLPKGRFLVKITATTRKGRKLSGTRRYLTCTPKSARQTIPLL